MSIHRALTAVTLLTALACTREMEPDSEFRTLPDGTVPSESPEAEWFMQHAYLRAAKFYEGQLGLRCEKRIPQVHQSLRVSADPDAFFNYHPVPMILEQPTESIEGWLRRNPINTQKGSNGSLTLQSGWGDRTSSLPNYNDSMMQYAKFWSCYREVTKNDYTDVDLLFIDLATMCQKNGLQKEFCIKRVLHITPYADYEYLVRTNFDLIYDTEVNASDCAIPHSTMIMYQLQYFLQSRYKFRRNSITGGVEYCEYGNFVFSWQPLTKPVINSITIQALSVGIEAWDKDIRRFIESTLVAEHDPVAEYLELLPQWDGTDHIRAFARRVPTDNPHWEDDFHTWMLSMVSQWMGRNLLHGNAMVPMIVGAQGDGKSTWCRMILPEELQLYYTDRLDFTKRTDTEKMLSRFCLINLDEYDSLTTRQNAFLKNLLQMSSVKYRQLYQTVMEQHHRYASFVGTTNDCNPLTDITGSRRYLCIRTTGQIDTTTPVDYAQLYAQAKEEILSGAQSYFTGEMERRIQLANAPFQRYDILEQAFMEMYCKPSATDTPLRITPTAILQRLHDASPFVKITDSNVQRLGNILTKRHFRKRRSSIGMKYEVKERVRE